MSKHLLQRWGCAALCIAAACNAHAQALPKADAAVGEVFASDASVQGSVVLAAGGASLLPGSTVDAGSSAAVVKLRRGGTVRVCPGSSLSINTTVSGAGQSEAAASGNSSGLMLSLGTGAIEANYDLAAAADTLITPDFAFCSPGRERFMLRSALTRAGTPAFMRLGETPRRWWSAS